MHLAQLNIGRFRHPTDDPRIAPFMNALDRINGLAERMPGFVWRLQDESGNATGIPVGDDPIVAINLTVWKNVEALETFVWKTVHKRFYDRRAEWFEAMTDNHFAMWWVEEGHQPTLAEALERLETLREKGDTASAFGWAYLKEARAWREAQCGAAA